MNIKKLTKISIKAKQIILDISYQGKADHIGSALSVSDIITCLYFDYLDINKNNVKKIIRDHFILSKGHSAAALYSLLYLKGFISKKSLYSFGKNYGLCKHPILNKYGVDMTSGSLGMGLGYAIGKAYSFKLNKNNKKVAVLISDGECNEGSTWESILLAPTLKLDNLLLIIDKNNMQCMGKTDNIVDLKNLEKKLVSFGWKVKTVDGHNIPAIKNSLKNFKLHKNHPKAIIAKTKTACGISFLENKLIAHYKVLEETEYQKALEDIKKI